MEANSGRVSVNFESRDAAGPFSLQSGLTIPERTIILIAEGKTGFHGEMRFVIVAGRKRKFLSLHRQQSSHRHEARGDFSRPASSPEGIRPQSWKQAANQRLTAGGLKSKFPAGSQKGSLLERIIAMDIVT